MDELWFVWLNKQSRAKRDKILYEAMERLFELDEVGFRVDDYVDENGKEIPEEEELVEGIYWKSNGEDL